jgi:hypothetical protein
MTLFGFFLVLSLFSVCYVNWAAPAYITSFTLAVAVVWKGQWRDKVKKRILASALILGAIISLSMYSLDTVRTVAVATVDLWAKIFKVNISGAHSIPLEKFPSSRLRGWREMGAEMSTLLNEMGRENTFIISYKRQYVSEVAFYTEDHPTVYTLNMSGHRQSQYDLWEGIENKIGFNALYITNLNNTVPESFAKAFDHVEEIKAVKIYAGKELIRGFSVFYCQGFHGFDHGL